MRAAAQFWTSACVGSLGFMLRFLSIVILSLAQTVWADDAAPRTPGAHEAMELRLRLPNEPLPLRDAARDAALQAIETHLACACYEAGDFHLDLGKGAQASACPCPFAAQMRADLEHSLAGLTTPQLADQHVVAARVETTFVPLQPEYERVFRYPRDRMDWFMKNVRCVCDGCKPTIFFAKCGLSCAPAIVYKLRAKVCLALGFTADELLDAYLADVNAHRPPRDQISRDYLLPGKQREKGWLVPALAIGGAALLLLWLLRRWSKRQRVALEHAPEAGVVSEATRRKVVAALDDDPEW